jgi:hypothetical protein
MAKTQAQIDAENAAKKRRVGVPSLAGAGIAEQFAKLEQDKRTGIAMKSILGAPAPAAPVQPVVPPVVNPIIPGANRGAASARPSWAQPGAAPTGVMGQSQPGGAGQPVQTVGRDARLGTTMYGDIPDSVARTNQMVSDARRPTDVAQGAGPSEQDRLRAALARLPPSVTDDARSRQDWRRMSPVEKKNFLQSKTVELATNGNVGSDGSVDLHDATGAPTWDGFGYDQQFLTPEVIAIQRQAKREADQQLSNMWSTHDTSRISSTEDMQNLINTLPVVKKYGKFIGGYLYNQARTRLATPELKSQFQANDMNQASFGKFLRSPLAKMVTEALNSAQSGISPEQVQNFRASLDGAQDLPAAIYSMRNSDPVAAEIVKIWEDQAPVMYRGGPDGKVVEDPEHAANVAQKGLLAEEGRAKEAAIDTEKRKNAHEIEMARVRTAKTPIEKMQYISDLKGKLYRLSETAKLNQLSSPAEVQKAIEDRFPGDPNDETVRANRAALAEIIDVARAQDPYMLQQEQLYIMQQLKQEAGTLPSVKPPANPDMSISESALGVMGGGQPQTQPVSIPATGGVPTTVPTRPGAPPEPVASSIPPPPQIEKTGTYGIKVKSTGSDFAPSLSNRDEDTLFEQGGSLVPVHYWNRSSGSMERNHAIELVPVGDLPSIAAQAEGMNLPVVYPRKPKNAQEWVSLKNDLSAWGIDIPQFTDVSGRRSDNNESAYDRWNDKIRADWKKAIKEAKSQSGA